MKFSALVSFLTLLLFCSGLFAQDFRERVLATIENRDYQTAVSELEKLQKSDKKSFEINNYDYLTARLQEKTGDFASAMANYQAVVNRNSVLKEYALWHLSQIARSSGNLLLERLFLQEILTFAPDSLLSEAVKNRLVRSYFESRNFDQVICLLTDCGFPVSAKSQDNKSQTNRENLALLGEAYLQSGKTEKAREIFLGLINNLPNPAQPDDFALAGAKGLDRLETGEKFGQIAPDLPDHLHLQRALIYQFNRDFANARLHYLAIIEKFPDSGNVPDAIYQIGRGFAQTGEYPEAEKWFERVLEQFPDHPVAKDALSQAASAYARVNKPREAISRYQKFIEKYPSDERIERAYLNIADILRDAGEFSEALKWTAKTQEVFRGKLPEAVALFSQLRIRIAQNDWENALSDAEKLLTLADLGGTRVPGGTNRAEVTFLKGFILENQQKFAEAIDVYLSIPDGRNEYYGWRATERLRALANDERAKSAIEAKTAQLRAVAMQNVSASAAENIRQAAQNLYRLIGDAEILEIIKKVYSELPVYKQIPNFKLQESGRKETLQERREPSGNRHRILADELLFLGLYDEATPELEKAESGKKGNKDFDFTLATFYKRGGMAHRAVGFIEPLWRNVPGDFQIELIPPAQAELLYPAPYIDTLLKFAPERSVDPRFVLSIIRQESRFRADVKSAAAARGLMQFISTTAERIARELGKTNFRQDDLYHPPTAILFGTQYLSNIYKMFPGQHAAVAASYNGGEENMKRWMTRAKSDDPDRYVPEIIFAQSKDYAYKVMANYRVYRIFYDENLKPRQAFR